MVIEILTKDELQVFKQELIAELKQILAQSASYSIHSRPYLQASDVRKMLGISPGTLQHLRVTGQLPFTKIGGKTFYQAEDIQKMMEGNKR